MRDMRVIIVFHMKIIKINFRNDQEHKIVDFNLKEPEHKFWDRFIERSE